MKTINGKITAVQPTGSYDNQYGTIFTTALTVQCIDGTFTGEIGSKEPWNTNTVGTDITLEIWKDKKGRIKLKRFDPKYANQQQGQQNTQQGSQQSSQQSVRDYDKENHFPQTSTPSQTHL